MSQEDHEKPVQIPDHLGPETTWLPIYNIRTPYDEDEIVHLISEIIRNFVRLSFAEEGEVAWPPAGGHSINTDLCNELNVSPAVQSLIRRLPYSDGKLLNLLLIQTSDIPDYRNDEDLRGCRSDLWTSETTGDSKVEPHDVVIAWGGRNDNFIVLDTKDNTIRVTNIQESTEHMNPPGTPLERPEQPSHYRNFWPQHAPTWLRVILNQIKALDVIPPGAEFLSAYVSREDEWLRRKIKHVLIGTYGWPDNFLQQAYDENRQELWEKTYEEYSELGMPQVLRFY